MADAGDPVKDNLKSIGLVFLVLFAAWLAFGGPQRAVNEKPLLNNPLATSSISSSSSSAVSSGIKPAPSAATKSTSGSVLTNDSPYKGLIRISSLGNARYEDNPDKEYIVLSANSSNKAPVDITGWKLKNGNDQKYDYQIAQYQEIIARADVVTIPRGVRLFSTSTQNVQAPIMLAPGQQAYLITGNPPTKFPFFVSTSFLLNKCIGYLAPWTPTTPPLPYKCGNFRDLPGLSVLSDACYNFIQQMRPCATPEYTYQPQLKDLSYVCREFVNTNFNYNACVNLYHNDKDFFGNTWYVFLRYRVDLWPPQRNSVTLYDQNGKIVDQLNY